MATALRKSAGRGGKRPNSLPGLEGEWRIGNVGLLLYEAARQGDVESLRFALALPDGEHKIPMAVRLPV